MASHWILQREEYKDKIELSPDEEEHTVGRGKENIIKCLSLYVSRRHCKIIQRHGRLTIIDLKSANGTFVNRTQILAEREIPLREGDLIGIGVCEITDHNCFVFKLLCQRAKNDVSPVVPLPDSSTADPDLIVLSDSDSQNGMVENREAKAKVLKRLGEQMNVIKSKIPRLEDPDSELAFNSSANFSNELLNKENISQVQNSEPSSEKSCRQRVKKINVEIRADDDVTSEKSNRERAETVILNSRSSDSKCKFEGAQDDCLRTSNVNNNNKTNPLAACKDEKNRYLDNISNSSDLNLHQPGANSSSSKPCVSETVFIKEQSDQTTEGYIKEEEEESNKFKQSSVKNVNKRTEKNVNLADVLELEGKIETLLESQPELKTTLLQQLMKLKNNVALCEYNDNQNMDVSDDLEKKKNSIVNEPRKSQNTLNELQIDFKTETEYETKPSTSKMHSVITKDEFNKAEECITNKNDYLETNVDCKRQTLDNALPSTSKMSSAISQSGVNMKEKHTTMKAANSGSKLESHVSLNGIAAANTEVSAVKKDSVSFKDEQKNLNKSSKNVTDKNNKDKKEQKNSEKDNLKVTKGREPSVLIKSSKKQKSEGNNDLSSESNHKECDTSVISKVQISVEGACSNSPVAFDLKSDVRLQDVFFSESNDFEKTGKKKISSSEESGELLQRSNSSDVEANNSKNKEHRRQHKRRILSTSSESFSNESRVNSRSSSIESNKLCCSENRKNIITDSTSGNVPPLESVTSVRSCGSSSSSDISIQYSAEDEDKILSTIRKNQLFVKLERLDDDKAKSLVKESQLNYTLDDDIIIISDDEDNMFPSSQVFDEKEPKIVIKEEILDDPSFNKVIEDEDAAVFEDDVLEADENEWLARLSQDIIETRSDSNSGDRIMEELPPLKLELDENDNADAEDTSKGMTLKFPFGDEKSRKDLTPDYVLDDDISKPDEKVHKQEDTQKSKSRGKLLIIDAPPMPPRKAKQRGISVEEATRLYNERKDQRNQLMKSKSVVPCDSTVVKSKNLKKKHRSHSTTEEINFLTATEKKNIVDIRKEKLKAISEKKKEAAIAAAAKANSTKVPANVRIKVTKRNRGAFLTEGAEVYEENENLPSAEEKNKAPVRDKNVPGPKKRELRSSSAPIKTIRDLPRIPKISNRPSENMKIPTTSKDFNDEMEKVLDSAPLPEILTSAFPNLPLVKALAPSKNEAKKSVRFKEGNALTEIRMIPVAEDSLLLPVARKKDAPPPKKIVAVSQKHEGPVLEEVIYDILSWNPKWLEEQKMRSSLEPPPVAGDKVWPMLSSFTSYNDYLKVLTPLILLDLWSGITKESQLNPNDPRKAPVIVGIDQVDQKPTSTPNQKQLMNIGCHAVLSEFESQRSHHPRVGDLVYLELELENDSVQNHNPYAAVPSPNKRKIVPIFAYVKSLIKEMVTGTTKVHKEILPHSPRPTCKISFILQTKFRPYDVKLSHAMRIKVVSYIKSDLRLFQALAYLPSSPLCNHILQPERQNFTLPDAKNVKFAPYIIQENLNDTQQRAILQTAQACLSSNPTICMIQGPPGTGKTHVIVNLIMQILYGQRSYRKHGKRKNSPRILVCAPSNAAVDELVLRLLQVRRKITKEERFKMVRTGRQETINPQVKDISLIELAKRDVKNTAQSFEAIESVELEIRNLEALKNSKIMALESARKKNLPNVREIEFKLGEIERKLLQMRKSKFQNVTIDPRELARMERDAQERVLLCADIVATTLSSCYNNQMENIYLQNRESSFQFTCCIVDEATQSQELETLIPLMLGVTTLILVGDAKQLPATVLSKVAKDHGLGKSLFARLQECFEDTVKNPVQFLETQYRMHPEICHWPNRFFYNSRLRTAPTIIRKSPLVPYCILSLEYKQDDRGELLNAGEAELVSQLTLGIIEKVGSKYSIGIITPYHKQRSAILLFLQSHCQGTQNVEVNTIDSFQGQERDIIVMSCVRTGGVGFLADTQRLNVALTRARHSLILCGNFTSLRNDSMWRALLDNAKQRKVLKHIPSDLAKNKEELLKLVLCE